jgi:hypothetical protein
VASDTPASSNAHASHTKVGLQIVCHTEHAVRCVSTKQAPAGSMQDLWTAPAEV